MRRLLLGLLGVLLLTATIPVTGEGPVGSEDLDATEISSSEPASAQQEGTRDETNRTLAPEFPFAVQGLPDGSHLWVGKGSVGRSMGEQILWAAPVPGGPPGPVNDPLLEVQDDRVHVLNGAGIHVYDVATGEALERVAMLEDVYPSGGFPLANEQGNVSVIHGQSFVEVHGPETSATLWEPPTYTRAVPLDIDDDGEESIAALSSDDWPNDEWWIRALSVDGTEHWNTTVDAFARGFPCLVKAQLDEDPAEEIMLAVGATTAAAVDDDGSILWRVEGHGYQNTLHCTAGDVTGDGLDDLVVASFDPYDRGAATIGVHEGSDGSIRWSAPAHKGASYLTLTDVDGDGIDDVIGATYGFSNPGFTFTKPGWTGGVRSNHLVAFDGDAEVAPNVHWRRTFTPNRGYMSSGAADLEVLEHPDGDRLAMPLREAGGLLLLDPSTGDTLDELAGSHRAQTATWLGDTGLVGGQDGNIWHTDPTGTGSRVWAEVPGSVLELDASLEQIAVGYGQGVRVLDADGSVAWDRRLAGPGVHASWLAGNLLVGEQDADLQPPLVSNLWLFSSEGVPIAQHSIAGGLWGLAAIEDRTGDGVPELVLSAVGQGRFASGGNELLDGDTLASMGDLAGPEAFELVPTQQGVLLLAQRSIAMLDVDENEIRWTRDVYPSDALVLPDGSLLVADWIASKLQRLDPSTGDVLATIGLDEKPGRLIDAGDKIIVEDRGDDAAFATYQPDAASPSVSGPFHGQSPIDCNASVCIGQPGPHLAVPVP